MYTHLLLSETPFSMCSKSALTTAHAVRCSNRGIPSASHRYYTALKTWRPTMPQVQVGVALTYLSNTTIVRSRAFVLYPHHPIFLEVSFSLWVLSMNHRSSTSKKHFITTSTLCILGEMPTPTVNRSQHLTTKLTALINSQHDHGGYLCMDINNS